MRPRLFIFEGASLLAAVCLASCGHEGGTDSRPSSPVIRDPPASQTVNVGQAATFSVNAETYGVPSTYQWFWNGWKVRGATQSSFTTRPAEVADNASSYLVELTNFYGTVSAAATLAVVPVPRAPKFGDLRFQGVDAAPTRMPLHTINFPSRLWMTYSNAGGTPLLTGSGLCGSPMIHPRACSWDGALDLAVANSRSDEVSILMNERQVTH